MQDIIKIAEEIMQSGKKLKLSNVYLRAMRMHRLSRERIINIIRYLKINHVLIEGAIHTKETVTINEYRNKILCLIRQNQGVTGGFLKRAIFNGRSSNQLNFHLKVLINFYLIQRVTLENTVLFLPKEMDTEEGIITYLTRDPLKRQLLALLLDYGPIYKSELVDKVDKTPETSLKSIYRRINKLFKLQVISEDSDKKLRLTETKIPVTQKVLQYSTKKGE